MKIILIGRRYIFMNGKHAFGMVKVGERGQISIPKEARDIFSIKPGDMLVVLGDEAQGGLALIKSEVLLSAMNAMLRGGNCDGDEAAGNAQLGGERKDSNEA